MDGRMLNYVYFLIVKNFYELAQIFFIYLTRGYLKTKEFSRIHEHGKLS